MISKQLFYLLVLIFGVKFESNSLFVYVLELITIKIQTEMYFNEVLLVTDCSSQQKKNKRYKYTE